MQARLSTLLALAALARVGAAQEGWTALPIPSLCAPVATLDGPARLDNGSHLILDRMLAVERERPMPSVLPLAALLGWLEDEAGRRRLALRFAPNAPPLLVRGDGAAVASVRALLAELERCDATRAIELRAWLIEGALELSTTRPDRAALARLTGSREPWASATTRSGETAVLGARELTSYVASYSVEVATDSGVADPQIGSLATGRTLHVRACRMRAGGAVHIEGLLDLSALESLQDFSTGTPDLGTVQVPSIALVQVAFSGVIDAGHALAVSIRGAGLPARDWTLLLDARTSPDTPSDGNAAHALRGLDLALLETPSLSLPMPDPGWGVEAQAADEPLVLREGLQAASVAELADDPARTGNRGARAAALWFPGYLLAAADDTARWSELDGLVAAFERECALQAELVLEHGELRILAPVAAGVCARVLAGRERTALVDYDVQVAQESWMPNPLVERLFDGLALQGRLEPARWTCDAWIARSEPPRTLERKEVGIGRMQAFTRACVATSAQTRVGAPRATLLAADGPFAALSVELRER